MANTIFNLDLNKNNAINPIIYSRLTDGNLRKITVNITNEGEPIDLTGWTIRFEGTSGGSSKVFDVLGVNILDAQNGKFEYTFSKIAFASSGAYKTAYFALEKDDMRETTNDIKIIVEKVADITAKDAEVTITELNKTIALINQKYNELNSRVNIYEGDIASLENWLNARKAEINTIIADAKTTFNQKLSEIQGKLDATNQAIENGDFYSKTQIDGKITSVNSTISSHVNNKSNPHAVTAEQVNAYTKAETNTFLGQKADDSGVVHKAGDETINGKKTFDAISINKIEVPIAQTTVDLGWGMSAKIIKSGNYVFINVTTTPTSNVGSTGGAAIGIKVPEGFRPLTNTEGVIRLQGNNNQLGSVLVSDDGNCRLISGGMNTGYIFHASGAWVAA